MSQEKPKKYRWLLWMMILSVFVFLISPFLLYRFHNRAIFNSKVKELAAAGFPVSADDLEAAYILPDGVENAADVYQKAFLLYVEPNEVEQELLPVRGNYERQEDHPPYPPEVMDAVKKSLDKNRECLELLDKAARMEHCLFPRTRTGMWFSNEYLSSLKKAAMVLVERNLYLAQTGQNDALFNSTLTCIGLADSTSKQPFLIDYLVTIALEAMDAAGLEDSLNLTRFSEAQLSDLQQSFRRMREKDAYETALINECAFQIEYSHMSASKLMSEFGVSSIPDKLKFWLYWASGLAEKDSVLLLDLHGRQIEVAQLPLHLQLSEINTLETSINAYPWFHYGLHMLAPSWRIGTIRLRIMGNLECAETALAIERYRLKYNVLPDSLEVLVPEFIDTVFLDPFDGKPLRYRQHESGGYTVYCIGEDGIDNGGVNREQMSKRTGTRNVKEYDHPFTVKH